MKITCPTDPRHHEFSVTAHVMEEWRVDEHGNWLETLDPSLDVSHRPDRGDLYTCMICGAQARVE